MASERLTKAQREELEALHEFGGKSNLHKRHWHTPTVRSLIRRGFMTWRRKGAWGADFRRTEITPRGLAAIRATSPTSGDGK